MPEGTSASVAPPPFPRSRGDRSAWSALAILLFITLLFRLFIIVVPWPDFYEPPIGTEGSEELLRGNGARDLIEGLLLPFQDYQVNDFWGGSLGISILAVPFFLLLGPTIVALRMSTLFFSLLFPLAAFLILDRFVSRRAAWIGGLLLCFLPPGYVFYSSIALGTHIEGTALSMLLIHLFLCVHLLGRKGIVINASLGFLVGLSISWGYGTLIILGLLLLFQLLYDKLFFLGRRFRVQACGFVVGLIPWILYNVNHGYAGLKLYNKDIHKHFDLGSSLSKKLGKLSDFFTRDLADSFWFKDTLGVNGLVLGQAMAVILGCLFLYSLWHWRDSLGRAVKAFFRRRIDPLTIHPILIFLAFPLL
ncbi:MAG: hypothetical protein ACYTG7_11140, partial [Planctomycetota bacterium]